MSLDEIREFIQVVNPEREQLLNSLQDDIYSLQEKLTQLDEVLKDASKSEKRLISQQIGSQLTLLTQLMTLF